MKILIYSHVFYPSIGGIEIVSATLADYLVKNGYQVTVVTSTPSQTKDLFPYQVIRQPSFLQKLKLVKTHDIIHSNGASMALFFYAKLLRKPFLWTHGGYQLSCIDGLGWVNGEEAPLNPRDSIHYHFKKFGFKHAFKEGFKLYLRRWVGKKVDANIAITHWVAQRQALPNQVVIYNPFPLEHFYNITRSAITPFDFIYVGRLVSEKGLPTLIDAFHQLSINLPNTKLSLAIVGDGDWRSKIELKVKDLQLSQEITFWGKKSGTDLYDIISKAKIAIVPSLWEEPMGGVAIELMAAGKNMIVSKNGGLAECVGKAALTFDNGNSQQLAEQMKTLYLDKTLQENQLLLLSKQLEQFNPNNLTKQYIKLYKKVSRNF
ncbi:MAG: glycosyltransferase family 1 protein [Cytophagales bacterium]|nr:MAG: glycosyltransferase family 1 protein [Cytophagales bacterium]